MTAFYQRNWLHVNCLWDWSLKCVSLIKWDRCLDPMRSGTGSVTGLMLRVMCHREPWLLMRERERERCMSTYGEIMPWDRISVMFTVYESTVLPTSTHNEILPWGRGREREKKKETTDKRLRITIRITVAGVLTRRQWDEGAFRAPMPELVIWWWWLVVVCWSGG